jgi:hypothetical protein
MNANRSSIGYEIEAAYLDMVEKRFLQKRIDVEFEVVKPKRRS